MNIKLKRLTLPQISLTMIERKHNCMVTQLPNGWWIIQCTEATAVPILHSLNQAYKGKEIRA